MNWEAFAAIGTTLGSLITAIALIVTIIENKKPYKKKLKIYFYNGIGGDSLDLFCIDITNIGIRDVNISEVYISLGKYKFWLDSRYNIYNIDSDKKLEPEDTLRIGYHCNRISQGLKKALKEGYIQNINEKIIILVNDKSGNVYKYKIEDSIKKFIS